VFSGLNSFLGNFLGEFLGEVSLNLFFLLSSVAMLTNPRRFPGWIAYSGSLAAFAGLVGMFRNATPLLDPVASANHYLLPVWMFIFGVSLIRDDILGINHSY
ncbi:MAG TPA: hypothetical protein VJZ25_00615, partial [Gemmatimonadaceae bacterium]|nr:hypothetical protein [Gemmatimonadaceae bacterium]